MLLFLDFETTGLDPEINSILEVGAFLTDDNGNCVNKIIDKCVSVPDPSHWQKGALDLHAKTGFLTHWNDAGKITLDAAWIRLYNAIPNGTTLVGFNPWFDHSWLPAVVTRRLHYRMIDLNTLTRIFGLEKVESPHFAYKDCELGLKVYRQCLALAAGVKSAVKRSGGRPPSVNPVKILPQEFAPRVGRLN